MQLARGAPPPQNPHHAPLGNHKHRKAEDPEENSECAWFWGKESRHCDDGPAKSSGIQIT